MHRDSHPSAVNVNWNDISNGGWWWLCLLYSECYLRDGFFCL